MLPKKLHQKSFFVNEISNVGNCSSKRRKCNFFFPAWRRIVHIVLYQCVKRNQCSLSIYIYVRRGGSGRFRRLFGPFPPPPLPRSHFSPPKRKEGGSRSTEPSQETSSLFPSRRRRLLSPLPSSFSTGIRNSTNYTRFPLASPPITTRRLPVRTSLFYGKSKDVNMIFGESAQSTFPSHPSFLSLDRIWENLRLPLPPPSSLPRTNQEEASAPASPSLGRKEDEEENIFQPCKRAHIGMSFFPFLGRRRFLTPPSSSVRLHKSFRISSSPCSSSSSFELSFPLLLRVKISRSFSLSSSSSFSRAATTPARESVMQVFRFSKKVAKDIFFSIFRKNF